jgi:hypothetical protein
MLERKISDEENLPMKALLAHIKIIIVRLKTKVKTPTERIHHLQSLKQNVFK